MATDDDKNKPGTQSIDEFITSAGVGSQQRAMSNTLYGINHSRIRANIPSNKSTYGWAFFTRPQLNLRTQNLRNSRVMHPLLTNKQLSIQRYVRNTLDPRLSRELYTGGGKINYYSKELINTPLVDESNPFIPMLTNSIKTMSGWPDEVMPTHTSTQGIRREQYAMVDGSYDIYDSFDLNVTFDNYVNDPLVTLFQTWTRYSSLVFEGVLSPYHDMIVENEIDYNTRIYRITTDSTWKNLNYIGATGASFPLNNNMGKVFDFNNSVPYSDQTKEISVRFKCVGAMYNDDILIKEFNQSHSPFNAAYKAYINGNKKIMEEIPSELREIMNFRGYPYIDPNNYTIKWLLPVSSSIYTRAIKSLAKKTSGELDALKSSMDILNNPGLLDNALDALSKSSVVKKVTDEYNNSIFKKIIT